MASMTTPDLIAELERLDAAATRGIWEAYADGENLAYVNQIGRGMFCTGRKSDGQPDIDDARLIAFLGTHRSRLLSALRREAEAVKLLREAVPFVGWGSRPAGLVDRIDDFLKERGE